MVELYPSTARVKLTRALSAVMIVSRSDLVSVPTSWACAPRLLERRGVLEFCELGPVALVEEVGPGRARGFGRS